MKRREQRGLLSRAGALGGALHPKAPNPDPSTVLGRFGLGLGLRAWDGAWKPGLSDYSDDSDKGLASRVGARGADSLRNSSTFSNQWGALALTCSTPETLATQRCSESNLSSRQSLDPEALAEFGI